MSRRMMILTSPFVVAVLVGLAAPTPVDPIPEETGPIKHFSMNHYLWARRPILVFSPSAIGPEYQYTDNLLDGHRETLAHRDVVVIRVLRDGVSRAGGREIADEAADELRETFEVGPGEFAIVLVGRDGNEEHRWSVPPSIAELLAPIDALPVRPQEPRVGRSDGGD